MLFGYGIMVIAHSQCQKKVKKRGIKDKKELESTGQIHVCFISYQCYTPLRGPLRGVSTSSATCLRS